METLTTQHSFSTISVNNMPFSGWLQIGWWSLPLSRNQDGDSHSYTRQCECTFALKIANINAESRECSITAATMTNPNWLPTSRIVQK